MSKSVFRTSLQIKLLLIGVSTLFSLLSIELLIRLLFPYILGNNQHPSKIWRDQILRENRIGKHHPILGWTLQPNKKIINRGWEFEHTIQTNSKGFRDDETPYERKTGIGRILLLGDSFGAGNGVERGYLFADQIEKALQSTEVVNLSVDGYGTDQELLLYTHVGIKYKSDIVMLALTIANDFENNLYRKQYGRFKPYYTLSDGKVSLKGVPVPSYHPSGKPETPHKHTGSPFPIHDFLDANSGLYAMVFDCLSRVPIVRKRWEKSNLLYPQEDIFAEGILMILKKELSPKYVTAWQLLLKLLEEWKKVTLQENSKPILVLIPSHLQVYPDIFERAIKKLKLNTEDFDPMYPNNRLKKFCNAHQIETIDLLQEFQLAAESEKKLFYKRNPHWNREGHILAAEVIVRELHRMGIR